MIADGYIIVLYHGRGEFGPRALGHRSIIADPRRRTMREWINNSIKGRELFRPLAPIVLMEDLPTYFETDIESPFMTLAVKVRREFQERLTAVTHVDGSARVQTVQEGDSEFLFHLLHAFKKETGVGVLLNTSFNGKNEPIVENERDAIETFTKFPFV